MRARNSYLLALLSGILLMLSYPPFNLGFLTWFAFVPVLIAVYYETKAKRVEKLALVMGICLIPTFLGMCLDAARSGLPAVVAWPVSVVFAGLTASYLAFLVEGYLQPKRLPRPGLSYLPAWPQIFVLPVVATAAEFLAMNIPVVMKITGALGAASVSGTQWLNPPILQLASFTGMYGVTFLIWLVNSALTYGIVHYQEAGRISKQVIAVLLVFIIVFVCGCISLPGATTGGTTVVIIQAKPSTMEKQHINELYADWSEYSLKYGPEIILWSLWPRSDRFGKAGPFADEYVSFSQENDVYLTDGEKVVFPDGRIEDYWAPYNGLHLCHVLDGFVPFDPDKLFPELYGFDARSGKFGFLGCLETGSTLPARLWVKDGTRFIAGLSGTPPLIGALPGLLGGNMVYRAVEHRIYTALFHRDNGLLIDPYGRIMEDIAPEPEIVAGKIAFTNGKSFYSKCGDIFGFTILGLFVALLSYNTYLKRKSPYTFCKECKAQIEKGTKVCPKCGEQQKRSWFKGTLIYQLWERISKKQK